MALLEYSLSSYDSLRKDFSGEEAWAAWESIASKYKENTDNPQRRGGGGIVIINP